MPASIDWMYHRNFCKTCEKAQDYLKKHDVQQKSIVDARKNKLSKKEILALAQSVHVIMSVKGKNIVTVDLKKNKPNEATLLAALLGPSGNLRAPTFRKGKILFVGFHPDGYNHVLKLQSTDH